MGSSSACGAAERGLKVSVTVIDRLYEAVSLVGEMSSVGVPPVTVTLKILVEEGPLREGERRRGGRVPPGG